MRKNVKKLPDTVERFIASDQTVHLHQFVEIMQHTYLSLRALFLMTSRGVIWYSIIYETQSRVKERILGTTGFPYFGLRTGSVVIASMFMEFVDSRDCKKKKKKSACRCVEWTVVTDKVRVLSIQLALDTEDVVSRSRGRGRAGILVTSGLCEVTGRNEPATPPRAAKISERTRWMGRNYLRSINALFGL